MKKIFILLCLIFIASLAFVQTSMNTNNKNGIVTNQIKTDSVTITTFKTDNTWGYDIYLKGKLYIHQPNIPAVQGTSGFKTEEYAMKTAELVVFKIKHKIIPPTVTASELDSLGVK